MKRTGERMRLRRAAIGGSVLIILVPLVGFVYEVGAGHLATRRFPPPGDMIDVGGYRLHWHCLGEGSPTVVLAAGGGWDGSLTWQPIHAELARSTRVCAYDRAGILWSESGRRPRSGERVVAELRTLLENTNTRDAIILVGHSIGGQHAIEFAIAHPSQVAGLVLVDASHPSITDHMPQEFLDTAPSSAMRKMMRLSSRIGLLRLFAGSDFFRPSYPLPDSGRGTMVAFMPRAMRASLDELEDGTLSYRFAAPAGVLRNMPVYMLSSASWFDIPNPPPGPAPAWADEHTRVWRQWQDSLAVLSTNTKREIVSGTGHFIHWHAPEQVIQRVNDILTEARAQRAIGYP